MWGNDTEKEVEMRRELEAKSTIPQFCVGRLSFSHMKKGHRITDLQAAKVA